MAAPNPSLPAIAAALFGLLMACADPVDPPAMDAGVDASIDAETKDMGFEEDAGLGTDAGADAGMDDVGSPDAAEDAGPPDAAMDAGSVDSGPPGAYALLPTNGANWNDYVQGAWRDVQPSMPDVACDPTIRNAECVHAGELRAIDTELDPDCAGLTIRDERGAFDWICDDAGNTLIAISVGLKPGTRLSDLLDLTTDDWANNAVVVNDGKTDMYASTPAVWWDNPVRADNDGLVASEAQSGTIYLVTAPTQAHYLVDADGVSLVIAPGIIVQGPGGQTTVVDVTDANYAWIEGRVDAQGDSMALHLQGSDHSVVRGFHSENARRGRPTGGVVLTDAWNNRLSELTLSNNSFGVYADPNPGAVSKRNRISGVRGVKNGTRLIWAGMGNLVWDIQASNHPDFAVSTAIASHIASATLTNNGGGVVAFSSAAGAIYLAATIAHTQDSSGLSGTGLSVVSADNNYFGGFAVLNSRQFGVRGESRHEGNVFADLYSGHNQNAAISMLAATNTTFTGVLKVHGNCEATGTGPGLISRTCSDTGTYGSSTYGTQSSDAVLSRPAQVSASFLAKVTEDDPINPHDNNTPGLAPFDTITDWVNFDNPYRTYGASDPVAFPGLGHRGPCGTPDECQIWDWSLVAGDTGDWGADGQAGTGDDRGVLLDALALPGGDDTWTHTYDFAVYPGPQTHCEDLFGATWANDTCQITFLRRAIEIMGDRVGNDNLLCESGEVCLYTPNIGAYQGHGTLVSAGVFQDSTAGGLTGISLLRYSANGR